MFHNPRHCQICLSPRLVFNVFNSSHIIICLLSWVNWSRGDSTVAAEIIEIEIIYHIIDFLPPRLKYEYFRYSEYIYSPNNYFKILIIVYLLNRKKLYSMRLFYIDFILEFWNDNPCADSASLIACLMTSIAADFCVPVNPSVIEYTRYDCRLFHVPQRTDNWFS